MRSIPILETSETVGTPTTDTRAQLEPVGDDSMSQAILRVLERVVEIRTRAVARGTVTERLRVNEVELFRGITTVAPIVTE